MYNQTLMKSKLISVLRLLIVDNCFNYSENNKKSRKKFIHFFLRFICSSWTLCFLMCLLSSRDFPLTLYKCFITSLKLIKKNSQNLRVNNYPWLNLKFEQWHSSLAFNNRCNRTAALIRNVFLRSFHIFMQISIIMLENREL